MYTHTHTYTHIYDISIYLSISLSLCFLHVCMYLRIHTNTRYTPGGNGEVLAEGDGEHAGEEVDEKVLAARAPQPP